MLAEKYRQAKPRLFDIKALDCTASVRNFICDYLTNEELLVSYAPHQEFGTTTAFSWLMGGYVCSHDEKNNSIIPVERLNYAVIRRLYEAGYLRVRTDISAPTDRIVLFGWSVEAVTYTREIIKAHLLCEGYAVTGRVIQAIAAHYGVKIKYTRRRGLFEIIKPDGEQIPRGKASRTCVLVNPQGEPVCSYKDMTLNEWEEIIYRTAKRAGTVGKPVMVGNDGPSTLSICKRAKR